MQGIAAWFAAKTIPWKWIGVFAGILILTLIVLFGYLHVEGLKNDLVEARTALAQEALLRKAEQARGDAIQAEHGAQVARIETLEATRSAIAGEVLALRAQIDELNEKDIESDDASKADAAVGDLNRRNRAVNRLLEDASGAKVRSGASR